MPPPASRCSSDCAPLPRHRRRREGQARTPLNGVNGRTAGTFEGFNYSPANKSSGITWGHDAFAKYIKAPMQEMPGTRMAFVGIKNDKDIEDLWAYLQTFGPDGKKK
jgi:cytochrome c